MPKTSKQRMTNDLSTMRVARKVKPASVGRWRIKAFTQTREQQRIDELKIRSNEVPERQALALRRVVPPGDYVSLQRRMIDQEVFDFVEEEIGDDLVRLAKLSGTTTDALIDRLFPFENRWIPIMSDTPDELEGHRAALDFHGAVLVTGLGLGCVVSGLLANDAVTRIDVIEIDPDVIELTGPYYRDEPRVHVWNASATDADALPADLHWDFAWHDIWTHIAERNLRDETAEHGISYGMLFDLWAPRVAEQFGWAYEDALEMRTANNLIRQRNIEWYEAVIKADEDEQVRMLQDKVIRDMHGFDGEIDERVRAAFDPAGELREHLRNQIRTNPEFLTRMRSVAEQDLNGDEPLGRPNEEIAR